MDKTSSVETTPGDIPGNIPDNPSSVEVGHVDSGGGQPLSENTESTNRNVPAPKTSLEDRLAFPKRS